VSPGFRTEKLLTFRVALPESKYKDQLVPSGDTFVWSGRQVPTFYDELLERLRSLPGVNSAAASGYSPFTSENNSATFETEEVRYMENKTPPRDVPMAFARSARITSAHWASPFCEDVNSQLATMSTPLR
jgi:hypothetical protein